MSHATSVFCICISARAGLGRAFQYSLQRGIQSVIGISLSLHFKIQMHGEEPLSCKGSLAVDSVNKAHQPAPPTSFRSILLEHDIAKHHHKWLRSRLVHLVGHLIKDSQCGGVQNRGADLASMVVRQFEEFTKERSLTTTKIFLEHQVCLLVHQSADSD